MKKILLVALMTVSSGAFAQAAVQQQQQTTTSSAVAAAQNAGNSQVITVAPVTTNVASDLKDQGATAAATNAKAAEAIAATNAKAAIDIANIQASSNSTGLKDQGATAAKTQSDAAIKIAEIQAKTAADTLAAGQKGLEGPSADAALANATALTIAAGNQAVAREVAGMTQKIANTPSVNGPQLVTSNDTCMGSTSGSANVPGIGIGFGTSWVDNNCKMLKNSRELWNMGMKGAAMALMCKDEDNREALELTGFECPQTTKAKAESKKVSEAQQPQYTDPIVRARLGMPELTASAK